MKKLLFIITVVFVISACSGDKTKPAKTVSVEPILNIVKEYKDQDFSIVLDDMKIEEEPDFMVYQQKYNILTVEDDSLHVTATPWHTVNQNFFSQHENDLGMEIVSYHDQKLSLTAKPVGFGWAIGNEKHGEWVSVKKDTTTTSNSINNSKWRTNQSSFFYWFWLSRNRRTYGKEYNGYQRNATKGTSYYGTRSQYGIYDYGTRSDFQKRTRQNFFTRKATNSSVWNNHKTSRSSSRYSSGSSTRSRSGGYGK